MKATTGQLDLFAGDVPPARIEYWRQRLARWPGDAFFYRYAQETTGWSMACQEFQFARWLYSAGAMSWTEYQRWQRFDRRVHRWDRRDVIQ